MLERTGISATPSSVYHFSSHVSSCIRMRPFSPPPFFLLHLRSRSRARSSITAACLMMKQTHIGERHGHPILVARGNNVFILHGAPRLRDVLDAVFGAMVDAET